MNQKISSTIHKGTPYAGNPHVRFDEGEVAPAATPRRGSLLYKKLTMMIGAAAVVVVAISPMAAKADEYSFFKYDTGTALNGYASYDAWREVTGAAESSASASTETISEAGHRTWSVSSGIDLITKKFMGFILTLF